MAMIINNHFYSPLIWPLIENTDIAGFSSRLLAQFLTKIPTFWPKDRPANVLSDQFAEFDPIRVAKGDDPLTASLHVKRAELVIEMLSSFNYPTSQNPSGNTNCAS